VLSDFIIVDMAGDVYTQIIPGRPFLAISGCKIDVKGGQLTFDVGNHHVEFSFFENRIVSPASFVFDEMPISHEIEMDDVWCCTNPYMFDWVSIEGPDLDYAKVEFATPIPPSITEFL